MPKNSNRTKKKKDAFDKKEVASKIQIILEKKFGGKREKEEIKDLGKIVLDICEDIYLYKKEDDIKNWDREKIIAERETRPFPRQEKAINQLLHLFKESPNTSDRAFSYALEETIKKGEIPSFLEQLSAHHKSWEKLEDMEGFLELYKEGLKAAQENLTVEGALSGDFFILAGLCFPDIPEATDRAQRYPYNIFFNSLLFHLTYIFRHFTAMEMKNLLANRGSMPSFGKPCIPEVIEIANLVFEEHTDNIVTASHANKVVSRLIEKK